MSIMAAMSVPNDPTAPAREPQVQQFPDNRGDDRYHDVLTEMAARTLAWEGPILIAAHVDPDGDALGSCLALARALRQLGKDATVVMEPPPYLAFLATEGELTGAKDELGPSTLVYALDAGESGRVWGVPLDEAAAVFNVDHHGTNDRFGALAVVEPSQAACAMLIKELVDELGAEWTVDIATPCLTGIITDTGNFRHGNTDREAFEAAGDLIDHGVEYAELTDRLQWRERSYFKLLGEVMRTVEFSLDDRLVTALVTEELRERAGGGDDDSDDFVGIIRYAQGALVAALIKERGGQVKVSVRTRGGVSAQRICLELGGGGHVAAAGATLDSTVDEALVALKAAAARELAR